MSDWLSEIEKKKASEEAELQRKKESQLRMEQEANERIAYLVSANKQKWDWINQVIAGYVERYNKTVPEAPYGKGGPEYSVLYHYRHDDRGLSAVCFGNKTVYQEKVYPYKIVLLKFIDENNLALSFQDRKERRLCLSKDSYELWVAYHDSEGGASEYKPLSPKLFEHYTRLVESSTVKIQGINESDISEWIKKAVTDPKLPDPQHIPESWRIGPPAKKSSCALMLLLGSSGFVLTILMLGKLIQTLVDNSH